MEELTVIHEIGKIMAESIVKFFADTSNQRIVQACINSGIQFETVAQIQESVCTGKTFVFTGSLEKFTRKDARAMVEKLGARASSSVSSKTDFVISGTSAGFKLENAKKLGIPVLSEDEFLEMMGD